MSASLAHLQQAWEAPLADDAARTHSQYCAYHGGELVRLLESAPPTLFARVAHAALRAFVLDPAFSCLGASAALRRGTYRFGAYDRLDDPRVSRGLLRDLFAFAAERRGIGPAFTTFVAVFREPVPGGERGFERALWSQLERLHEADRRFYPWDGTVSSDPAHPRFAFSLGGTAFFIVGLHPHATRRARRFAWPALAFNAHAQFDDLRRDGRFAGLQRRIRERDLRLQGTLNANLSDFGEASEARQYAGREVERGWQCPFRPR